MGFNPLLNALRKPIKRNMYAEIRMEEEMFDSVYEGKIFLLGMQFHPLWEFLGGCLYPHLHRLPGSSNQTVPCTRTVQWHHLLHICQRQWQISFSTPSVTKLLHSQSVLSLINQPDNTHIFLWPSEREFIIQPLTKSGTPQAVLATIGEVTHIPLIYWHDILDIAK